MNVTTNPLSLSCQPPVHCCRCTLPHPHCSIVSSPNLKNLRRLDLSEHKGSMCCITDASMAAIATNLTALTYLCVKNTRVTAAGKRQVLQALPAAQVLV